MTKEMYLYDDRMKRIAEKDRKKESYENAIDVSGMKEVCKAEKSPNLKVRYDSAFHQADKSVMRLVENMEVRLSNRQLAIIDSIHKLLDKRPKTLAILFTRGKAARTWQKAIDTQKAALHRVQKRMATLTAIRSRQSNYQRSIQTWTRKRALKIDAEAIHKHEKAMERQRLEEEKARREVANEFARLKAQHLEKGRQQANCLERKLS